MDYIQVPVFYEVRVDFATSGIDPKWKKTTPLLLSIDIRGGILTYYAQAESPKDEQLLVYQTGLNSVYIAESISGTNNGFLLKMCGNSQHNKSQTFSVSHYLANTLFDSRDERELVLQLFKFSASKDLKLLNFFSEKWFKFPKDYAKDKFPIKVNKKIEGFIVPTLTSLLIFFGNDSIPRRSLSLCGFKCDNEKGFLRLKYEIDKAFKDEAKIWGIKDTEILITIAEDKITNVQHQHMLGAQYILKNHPQFPASVEALREEIFAQEAKFQLSDTRMISPSVSAATGSARSKTTQQTQELQQRQRSVAADYSIKKVNEDVFMIAPPPPPPDDFDSPPPPPLNDFTIPLPSLSSYPTTTTIVTTTVVKKLQPMPEDDFPPPPPPGGDFEDHDMPPPPPPGSNSEQIADDNDDDELPPPPGLSPTYGQKSGFRPAASLAITNETTLLPSPTANYSSLTNTSLTPQSPHSRSGSIQIEHSLPPRPEDNDFEMPLPPLAKNRASMSHQLQPPQLSHPSGSFPHFTNNNDHISPLPPKSAIQTEVHVEILPQGDMEKEIRTETTFDSQTGEITKRVIETVRPRASTFHSTSGSILPDDIPLPPIPCPPGCHYKYTSSNPLNRKCQMWMDDAALGFLDQTFKLPFVSMDGAPVYAISPDPACDLPLCFLITTNGLTVEYRINLSHLTPDDSLLASVVAETPLHLLGKRIAQAGQSISFLAQGCIPGSEAELERFLPPEDEEIPFQDLEPFLLPPPQDELPPLPIFPPNNLSIDTSFPTSASPSTPASPSSGFGDLMTPSAATAQSFQFGQESGIEITIKYETSEDIAGVIEIPSSVNPAEYTFATLREQILEELEDLPEEFLFIHKGAKLTGKQEPKKTVASLTEPIVYIRDMVQFKAQQQREQEMLKKRQEQEELMKLQQEQFLKSQQAPNRAASSGPNGTAPARPAPAGPPGTAPVRTAPARAPPRPQTSAQAPTTMSQTPLPNRPGISMAALNAGASGLKKTSANDHPSQSKLQSKPPDFLSEIKEFRKGNKTGLISVDHTRVQEEKKKFQEKKTQAGGMFVSLKAAMASRRQAVDEAANESDDDDWTN